MTGEDVMDKVSTDVLPVEIIDCMKGLMDLGYVDSDKSSFYNLDEFKSIHFRVNSGYAKELREALNPTSQRAESKRVRANSGIFDFPIFDFRLRTHASRRVIHPKSKFILPYLVALAGGHIERCAARALFFRLEPGMALLDRAHSPAGGGVAAGSAWRRAALGYVAGLVFFTATFWWLSSLAALYGNPGCSLLPGAAGALHGLVPGVLGVVLGCCSAASIPGGSSPFAPQSCPRRRSAPPRGWPTNGYAERLFGGFGWNPLRRRPAPGPGHDPDCRVDGHAGLSWLVLSST